MGTSQRTFEQVKSILGKLDQRIDNLRQRRAEPAMVPNGAIIGAAAMPATTSYFAPITNAFTAATLPATAPVQAQPAPATPEQSPTTTPSRSPYGKATPIRRV
jgi:hypothetical protein